MSSANHPGLFEVVVRLVLAVLRSRCAGFSRPSLPAFLALTVVGRILWTSAYVGIGYTVGANLEAAAGFLTNLSILLVSSAVLVTLGLVAVMSPQSTHVRA